MVIILPIPLLLIVILDLSSRSRPELSVPAAVSLLRIIACLILNNLSISILSDFVGDVMPSGRTGMASLKDLMK